MTKRKKMVSNAVAIQNNLSFDISLKSASKKYAKISKEDNVRKYHIKQGTKQNPRISYQSYCKNEGKYKYKMKNHNGIVISNVITMDLNHNDKSLNSLIHPIIFLGLKI
jgi:hypothetical protein